MKLVKIKEDLYLNSDFIKSVEADGEESTLITMISGGVFSPNVSIKKVLDAICGSEEHLVDEAIIEMLYKANNKSSETNELLLNRLKSLS
ncbi:hypothetical protein [Pediococcus pentosaceus]|uniref:hypothetical protein n=1 Tax=Pediococcus pentosaceus TaxID=1255 RepID=UPI00223ACF46|nr:hypothetical protein [Pediococcus pentosaceus]MCS8572972.1 hypothetical protein [Pediococcus pentosaceus]